MHTLTPPKTGRQIYTKADTASYPATAALSVHHKKRGINSTHAQTQLLLPQSRKHQWFKQQSRSPPAQWLVPPLPQWSILLILATKLLGYKNKDRLYLLLKPAHGFFLSNSVLGSDVASPALLVSNAETRPAQHLPGEKTHSTVSFWHLFIFLNLTVF